MSTCITELRINEARLRTLADLFSSRRMAAIARGSENTYSPKALYAQEVAFLPPYLSQNFESLILPCTGTSGTERSPGYRSRLCPQLEIHQVQQHFDLKPSTDNHNSVLLHAYDLTWSLCLPLSSGSSLSKEAVGGMLQYKKQVVFFIVVAADWTRRDRIY